MGRADDASEAVQLLGHRLPAERRGSNSNPRVRLGPAPADGPRFRAVALASARGEYREWSPL